MRRKIDAGNASVCVEEKRQTDVALETTFPALSPVRREGEGNVVGATQEFPYKSSQHAPHHQGGPCRCGDRRAV